LIHHEDVYIGNFVFSYTETVKAAVLVKRETSWFAPTRLEESGYGGIRKTLSTEYCGVIPRMAHTNRTVFLSPPTTFGEHGGSFTNTGCLESNLRYVHHQYENKNQHNLISFLNFNLHHHADRQHIKTL
jgi:hypothetical protein